MPIVSVAALPLSFAVRREDQQISDRLYENDDFEAVIRIYSEEEGGRRTAVRHGVRWDFAYADDPPAETLYMIWPDFFTTQGQSRSSGERLPIGVDLPARMTVAVDEMRTEVHRHRIRTGVRFFCHEGGRRVGEGVVTRITGLFAPRK